MYMLTVCNHYNNYYNSYMQSTAVADKEFKLWKVNKSDHKCAEPYNRLRAKQLIRAPVPAPKMPKNVQLIKGTVSRDF
jgi:hypothetical protein